MINILIIHQSAELYGSDKTLLILLKHIDKTKFNSVVVLPFDGPLKSELEKENIKVVIAPVLKLYRKMFSAKNLLNFYKEKNKGIKILDELHKEYKFDLVYSNTLAVLLGMIYAKKRKIKHLWHVHEIIKSPKIFTSLFRKFLQSKSTSTIVYNSIATMDFWVKNSQLSIKSLVIWNGLEIPKKSLSDNEILSNRVKYFNSSSNDIIIALVGRISRWKGQQFLLNAFSELSKKHTNIKLAFIGSPPPNQEIFLEELNNRIFELKLSNRVIHIPFTKDILKLWQSIDIAVVPSTEPEPFGLVAVEAMFCKKPVVGSNHGGLTEIIVNNETGFLVKPNNVNELFSALQKLISNQELRIKFGDSGYNHAIKNFSVTSYVSQFEELFLKTLS